tara:strand:+ start:63 stop:665 length:603 start_codon:yes stop_codon:yes gene_type:complete
VFIFFFFFFLNFFFGHNRYRLDILQQVNVINKLSFCSVFLFVLFFFFCFCFLLFCFSLYVYIQGSDPAIDLLDKLSHGELEIDGFLIEVTKVFCSAHELEIDMLKHVHDAMIIPGEDNNGSRSNSTQNRLDYKSFVAVLPILGVEGSQMVLAEHFLEIGRSGQEKFVDFILDNTNRFQSGSYQPLIAKSSAALSVLLSGV